MSSSREKSKQAAKQLLALCAARGVKLPTDPGNAAVVAGTMLNSTKEDGEFQMDKALEEMIKKFGTDAPLATKKRKAAAVKGEDDEAKPEKGKKRGAKAKKKDEEDEDEEDEDGEPKAKKPRQKAAATVEANQPLADAFAELSGFEFKRGEKFKGGTWSKVAKAIRDCEDEITSGKQALKLKGIGKSSAAKIDEFLETGTLEKLEEYRAGNM